MGGEAEKPPCVGEGKERSPMVEGFIRAHLPQRSWGGYVDYGIVKGDQGYANRIYGGMRRNLPHILGFDEIWNPGLRGNCPQ
jgi:hypothetical protein